mgnify:CR=1 FL=1
MPYGQPSGHRKFPRKKRRAATSTVVVHQKKRQISATQYKGQIIGAPQRTVSGKVTGEEHVYQKGKRARRRHTAKEAAENLRRLRAKPRRQRLDLNKPPLVKRKRDPGPEEGDDPDDPNDDPDPDPDGGPAPRPPTGTGVTRIHATCWRVAAVWAV